MDFSEKRTGLWALLCALAAIAAFLPALSGGFVWDDVSTQEHLPAYRSLADPFTGQVQPIHWIYRPLPTVLAIAAHRANDALFGEPYPSRPEERVDPRRARLPHALSLLIHALTSALVLLLVGRCLRGRKAAPIGAIAGGFLFALHPIHVENVVWTSAVADSLAALFLLGSLWAALDASETRRARWHVASGSLFLLALLSKESAAAGILLLPLVLLLNGSRDENPGWRRTLWMPLLSSATALAAYLCLRLAAGGGLPGGTSLPVSIAFSSKLIAGFGFYVWKTLFPWPMTPFVGRFPASAAVAGSLLAVALLVPAVRAWRSGERLYLLCALWFAVAVGPFLLTVNNPPTKAIAAERYLYLPSIALALAAGGLAAALSGSRYRRVLAIAFGALLLACGVSCWRGAVHWSTPISLWRYVTSQTDAARFPLPWVNLGSALRGAGERDQARLALQHAIDPGLLPDQESRGIALGTQCLMEAEQGWPLLEASRWADAVRQFAAAQRFCLRAATNVPGEPGNVLNTGVAGMGEFIARRAQDGTADLALLEEACKRIEAAARQKQGDAWAEKRLEECRQLRREAK